MKRISTEPITTTRNHSRPKLWQCSGSKRKQEGEENSPNKVNRIVAESAPILPPMLIALNQFNFWYEKHRKENLPKTRGALGKVIKKIGAVTYSQLDPNFIFFRLLENGFVESSSSTKFRLKLSRIEEVYQKYGFGNILDLAEPPYFDVYFRAMKKVVKKLVRYSQRMQSRVESCEQFSILRESKCLDEWIQFLIPLSSFTVFLPPRVVIQEIEDRDWIGFQKKFQENTPKDIVKYY